jgi:hypothetical protein
MRAASDPAVQCDHSAGCVTCGDEAVTMLVLRLDRRTGLALCSDERGAGLEEVEVELVGPVEPGDRLLVHARVALQRLPHDDAGAPAEGRA